MKRGQEIKVSRVPTRQGYVWEGYWEEDQIHGIKAIPMGRIRTVYTGGMVGIAEYKTKAIWLDIGGYLIL